MDLLNEIKLIPGYKKYAEDYIMIQCPFHSDSTPSCGINIGKSGVPFGFFNCLGCNTKGPWNKLAEKLGLQKLTEEDNQIIIPRINIEEPTLDGKLRLPLVNWRTIPSSTLKAIGAFRTYEERFEDTVVILPNYINGELVGYITAREKKTEMAYINSIGDWSKKWGLFPYDFIARKKKKAVVITEGPRDALKLISYKIPALAVLGAGLWSTTKKSLLLNLDTDFYIFFDGDKVGVKNSKIIYDELSESSNVELIDSLSMSKKAGHKIDPANCDEVILKQLKRLCR